MRYAGFWRRFGAYWLDVLVYSPVMIFAIWGSNQARLFDIYWFLPSILIGLWFHVYLVQRYGGTPGKLLMNLEITKVDGTSVGYTEALLRYSVLLVLSIAASSSILWPTLAMTDAEYHAMGWQERALYLADNAPGWYSYITLALNIWIWSEFLVMLTNKKRRAIHDFIAGTVVIHKPVSGREPQATDEVSISA